MDPPRHIETRVSRPRVAYQGEPGAYSEKAAFQLLGSNIQTAGLESFASVFEAVENGSADYAMLPIENSLGGSIHANYDLMLRHNLFIIAELHFRVEHCLLALPGTKKSDLKNVISHPQALAQCDEYLRRLGLKPDAEYDTAGSAKLVRQKLLQSTAAIASDLAAKYYELDVLDTNIEDDDLNYTRFLLLSREPLHLEAEGGSTSSSVSTMDSEGAAISKLNVKGQQMKTSIVFSFGEKNEIGYLHRAIAAFTLRRIDLTKIESRPARAPSAKMKEVPPVTFTFRAPGELEGERRNDGEMSEIKYKYMFYLDCLTRVAITEEESHLIALPGLSIPVCVSTAGANFGNALRDLREFCPIVRVLGCFPTNGTLLGPPSAIASTSPLLSPTPARRLRVGIVGFGTFGQFLAKTFVRSCDVFATSRSDYAELADKMNVKFVPFFDISAFFENQLDVVILSTSILSFENLVSEQLPLQSLKNTLVVDVLSVKVHAKNVLLHYLPEEADILCTHPMFGPESGAKGWRMLPFVFERVRITCSTTCERFLSIFEAEGCRMIELSSESHDQLTASSQFITHMTGRVLAQMRPSPSPVDTKGFESLLKLVDNTIKDSFDLFYGLYKYNNNSSKQIEMFSAALKQVSHLLEAREKQEQENEREKERRESETLRQSVEQFLSSDAEHAEGSGDGHRQNRFEGEGETNARPGGDRKRSPPRRRSSETGLQDNSIFLSPLIGKLKTSATVQLHSRVMDLRAEGREIVSLCVGEPDYLPPKRVLLATREAVDEGMIRYTQLQGTRELRRAVCEDLYVRKRVRYSEQEIVVTCGAKHAVAQAIMALCGEGDEVLIPVPGYPSYEEMVKIAGARAVLVETKMEEDFHLTPEALAHAITPKTKLLILCNPCNPTGAVIPEAILRRLSEVLMQPENQRIFVLTDEIYEQILYGVSHRCFASLPGMWTRTVIATGVSKSHAMTGYRIGFLAAPLPIAKAVATIQSQLVSCVSSVCQYAALAALSPEKWKKREKEGKQKKRQDAASAESTSKPAVSSIQPETRMMEDRTTTNEENVVEDEDEDNNDAQDQQGEIAYESRILQQKRDYVISRLRSMPNVTFSVPEGAFYILPNLQSYIGRKCPFSNKIISSSMELCMFLLEKYSLAIVPGEAFSAPGFVRISFATDLKTLEKAMDKMAEGLKALLR